MPFYVSFPLQGTIDGIWKALMLSIRSCLEGPKYGEKKTYLGTLCPVMARKNNMFQFK
jgi:hypothetical protein